MDKIYIFSGLGVDESVFDSFSFEGMNVQFITWITPLSKESIAAYAKRLALQIKDDLPILIGLSFGGMVAVEIAQYIPTKKVILIASAQNKYELPIYYRIAGKLNMHKLIPPRILKSSNPLAAYLFGVTTKAEKALLKTILHNTDPLFLAWAIDQIVKWKRTAYSDAIIHIHGTKDKILPIRNTKPSYCINQGGHFMTVNKSIEIENLLLQIIA